jgi:hypothetical protein
MFCQWPCVSRCQYVHTFNHDLLSTLPLSYRIHIHPKPPAISNPFLSIPHPPQLKIPERTDKYIQETMTRFLTEGTSVELNQYGTLSAGSTGKGAVIPLGLAATGPALNAAVG